MAVKVVDFFCGCGGTSQGMKQAGFEIALGLDMDVDSSKSYRRNFPHSDFILKDINDVSIEEVEQRLKLDAGDTLVFCGCAPCQPFSRILTKEDHGDPRRNLLSKFGEFIKHLRPDYVVVENVPGIQKVVANRGPFKDFLDLLTAEGYGQNRCRFEVVRCQHYGVPQCRQRLLLIATKHLDFAPWPVETHGPQSPLKRDLPTVWDAIGNLPEIRAGENSTEIANHQAMRLSELNLKRIEATPPEKGRESWPTELRLKCHKDHRGHSDVYGRLRKNTPSPALTTKCISLSNGRFGHPVQHRAISVREAALLQTFPMDFKFEGGLGSMARQIGNAVPVALAMQIGLAILAHDQLRRREVSYR